MSTHDHRLEIFHTWTEVDDVGGEIKKSASVSIVDFELLGNEYARRGLADMLQIPLRPSDCPARRQSDDAHCRLPNGHVGHGHDFPE